MSYRQNKLDGWLIQCTFVDLLHWPLPWITRVGINVRADVASGHGRLLNRRVNNFSAITSSSLIVCSAAAAQPAAVINSFSACMECLWICHSNDANGCARRAWRLQHEWRLRRNNYFVIARGRSLTLPDDKSLSAPSPRCDENIVILRVRFVRLWARQSANIVLFEFWDFWSWRRLYARPDTDGNNEWVAP